MSKSWFDVDTQGLRQLQEGKPKWFAVRELIANAFDEDGVKTVFVTTKQSDGKITIIVEDDSPTGFRDLRDAYTLFAPCYKRSDASKRGRFNVGEKQSFSICQSAVIETTKGTVTFDKDGRHESPRKKRENGTVITITMKGTKEEQFDIDFYTYQIMPPDHIAYWCNGEQVKSKTPKKVIKAKLMTEYLKEDKMQKTIRDTEIKIYDAGHGAWLYELGIPVCKIDCDYSISVDQRIPMGIDRDMVSEAYLKDLFAEVLNVTYDELTETNASSLWVRTGMEDERVNQKAVSQVLEKRYGDKVAVFSPNNPIANDEALANGYRLVSGSEMSGDEWANVKQYGAMRSSSDIFKKNATAGEYVEPDEDMAWVANLAKKIAKEIMCVDLRVEFRKPVKGQWDAQAYYNQESKTMTFNVGNLGKRWFDADNLRAQLDLIIHEIGHEDGHHCEASYHQALTKIGSALIVRAMDNPDWFRRKKGYTEAKDIIDESEIPSLSCLFG